MTKRLAVLTTGRQDWGLLRPLCAKLNGDPEFNVQILAGGMALAPAFGRSVDRIRSQGFAVARELPWDVERDPVWDQCAAATTAVGNVLQELEPDALVLLGDRFETAAAALAATVVNTPIAHLYGGEETVGAIDNALRHSITKLSHLHLAAHPDYARRIVQMGEDPSTVHVVGSLGVENILRMPPVPRGILEDRVGCALVDPIGLVTVHPTTLSASSKDVVVDVVIEAMEKVEATWVVTLPNADPGHASIRRKLTALAARNDKVVAVEALGEELYIGLMRESRVVLGNSSSGMTEAPALGIPTVNVGNRQQGRLRFPSIVDVPPRGGEVIEAVRRILQQEPGSWRSSAFELGGPRVSERIREVLKVWRPSTRKVFRDLQLELPSR